RTWKQPRCPSTEEWITRRWFIYTMEYYSAEKNSDIMKFAGKWMELENIILSKVTRTQKYKHGIYSLTDGGALWDVCGTFRKWSLLKGRVFTLEDL
ncbi:hypothetical protein STEG23_020585, partial [Scotinomys teguina]